MTIIKKRISPNKEWKMKKSILVLLTAVMFTIFGLSAGEASTDVDSPFPLGTPDNTLTFSVTDLGNGDHGVVFTNNAANTASAVILDSLGNPDNSVLGSSFMAADWNLSPDVLFFTDESSVFTSPYPAEAPDQLYVYNADSLNGYDHAVVFLNNFAGTAMGVVLDPDGNPDNFLLGYAFLAVDFKVPPDGTWWYSKNGLSWYCLLGCN